MILPALIGYYNRLESDPKGDVAPFGFSREKISFCLVLEPDGSLHGEGLEDVRREVEGKMRAQLMVVPERGGRSGTLIKPNFLWDNTGYVLGRDSKGKPHRSRKTFEAFRDLHLRFAEDVDDEGLHAVCRFLSTWDPAEAETLAKWEEACDANVVFRLRGTHAYVHDSAALREAWLHFVTDETDSQPGYSLATGEREDLARLHPLVQGVVGAQSTGAALVGFNLDAFTSYGKKQSYNAPLGVRDAFRYTTALNRLLADPCRRVRIGDATVVFWSDRPTPFEDLFGVVINEPSAEDPALNERVRAFLERLKQGRVGDPLEDADVPFYVLGLSPNASRLSVRFWLAGSVGQFAERLDQHAKDLEMTGARPDDPPLIIRRLLLETAREAKDIPPLLAGAVARAVLAGGPYPEALYGAVLRRIHADRRVNHRRAAILKACLVRKHRTDSLPMEVPVSLNTEHPDPAYHLGRLFATLEKIQEDAHRPSTLNRTIRDGYFGAASASPGSVFPRLMRLTQHHLAKLPPDVREARERKVRTRSYYEKLMQEVCSHLEEFRPYLPLEKQGLFHIAYYHQRQAFFEKKSDKAPSGGE